jgi:hypothetical protein
MGDMVHGSTREIPGRAHPDFTCNHAGSGTSRFWVVLIPGAGTNPALQASIAGSLVARGTSSSHPTGTPDIVRTFKEVAMSRKDREETRRRHRTTIDDAREQGIGEPETGSEPTVPSYTDTGEIVDLGVDEPVVPRDQQGTHDPESRQPDESRSG